MLFGFGAASWMGEGFWRTISSPVLEREEGRESGKMLGYLLSQENLRSAAVAFVIKDCKGRIMEGVFELCVASSAFEAEFLAMERVMDFGVCKDLHDVCFEYDSKHLINCLNSSSAPNNWRCFYSFENILFKGNFLRTCLFAWVPREANMVANWIVKVLLKELCPLNWAVRPPISLLNLLERDCPSFRNCG
ncbi:uncharacterized protein LOC129299870 [Prosopis cineraria]|uniref:uncharacterized protein LOC129299870 n=1 Tax=Prosopis cineraria TaxID=364024 RepID=UPI00241060BF|nr:uncharacterized protein LOC129299870 [Prosopis cineraria]